MLSPICGEVLSGSTPIAMFVNPLTLLFLVGLYGLGALLVRELIRSRGLGWSNLLLLGAAYGVLEEGLVVTSWTNRFWPDAISLGDRGRLLDINWIWAVGLTTFHAVESIAVPVVLAEALFPARAHEPWLSDRGRKLVAVGLAIVSAVELLLFGFLQFRDQGYAPPASYFLALAIAAALVWIGLRRSAPSVRPSRMPSLWRLRGFGFAMTVAFFVALWALPDIIPIGIVPVALIAVVAWFAADRVRHWSADPGWGPPQRLALASGVIGFFLALAPLLEFGAHPAGKSTNGMTAFALITVVVLVWLARREPAPLIAAVSSA